MRLITRSSPLRIINRVDFEMNNRIEKKSIETDRSTHNQCVFKFIRYNIVLESPSGLSTTLQPHPSDEYISVVYLST